MKIFLKALDKLKKSESSEQECKYDKGWNDAIKKDGRGSLHLQFCGYVDSNRCEVAARTRCERNTRR